MMQQLVNVHRDAGGSEAMADGVGENDPRRAVCAAGKQRVEVAAFGAAGRQGDHVALKAGQLNVTVCPLVAGPQLNSAKWLLGRSWATEFRLLSHDLYLPGCFRFI